MSAKFPRGGGGSRTFFSSKSRCMLLTSLTFKHTLTNEYAEKYIHHKKGNEEHLGPEMGN